MNEGVDDEPSSETWLRYAEADLALIRASIEAGAPAGEVCFHAQQAAEKALKALLRLQEVEPPRIHNLVVLRELADVSLGPAADEDRLERLTDLESQSRYPGNWPEPSGAEAVWASEMAQAVVLAVREVFRESGS